MVTKQEFISALLEPLPAAMAPLAVADAPGAVVRGKLSGQSLSEAFGDVMADPTSMEGRVYGEDVTGDPYSGMVFELLTDPTALASLGTAGLGMALSRRAFLKRAGRAAAAASLPGKVGVGDILSAIPGKAAKEMSDETRGLMQRYRDIEEALQWVEEDKLHEIDDFLQGSEFRGKKPAPIAEWDEKFAKILNAPDSPRKLLKEQESVALELQRRGWTQYEPEDSINWSWEEHANYGTGPGEVTIRQPATPDDPSSLGGEEVVFRRQPHSQQHMRDIRESWVEEIRVSEEQLREAYEKSADIHRYPERERLRKKREELESMGYDPGMPPGRGPRPGLSDIRPTDLTLLERLIREISQQAPGGRYGY